MAGLRSLWHSERGNTGVLFALSAVPLIAMLGGGVDLARQNRYVAATQSALDAAALAAARSVADDVTSKGLDRIDYGRAEERARASFTAAMGRVADAEMTFAHDGTEVAVSSIFEMPTSFLPVIGIEALKVNASASADMLSSVETCVYVTAPSEQGVNLHASSDLAADCKVWVESSNARAIQATAASTMQAKEICANGGTFLWATSTVSPAPEPCEHELRDPLRALGTPDQGGCDVTDLTVKGNGVRLRPGVYCGTTTIRPASHATLEPGDYVFRDGQLVIGSGSSAEGDDILLYFRGEGAGLNVGNGARFYGSGRRSGEFAGLLIYIDRDCEDCATAIEAGGSAGLEGTVYTPSAPFLVQSHGSTLAAKHALFIVYQLMLESSARFTVKQDFADSEVPVAYADSASIRIVK